MAGKWRFRLSAVSLKVSGTNETGEPNGEPVDRDLVPGRRQKTVLLSTGISYCPRHDSWRLRRAEHGIAVKLSKSSRSYAGQPERGIAWCWRLDLSWLLVVVSACICPRVHHPRRSLRRDDDRPPS